MTKSSLKLYTLVHFLGTLFGWLCKFTLLGRHFFFMNAFDTSIKRKGKTTFDASDKTSVEKEIAICLENVKNERSEMSAIDVNFLEERTQ